MNRYQFISLLLAIVLGAIVYAALFCGSKTTQDRQINLEAKSDSLLEVISARDLYIDSLEKINQKMDGVIVSLAKRREVGRKQWIKEDVRLDTITNYELTKEILDYYNN